MSFRVTNQSITLQDQTAYSAKTEILPVVNDKNCLNRLNKGHIRLRSQDILYVLISTHSKSKIRMN